MENSILDVFLYIGGAIITLSAAIAILNKFFKKHVTTVAQEISNQTTQTLLIDIKDISTKLEEFKSSYQQEQSKYSKALMNLAQDRLNQAYDEFMRIGKINSHSMYVIEQLYDSYKSLGGNGHAESQIQNLRELNVKTLQDEGKADESERTN
jgi:DNA polymerase III gamma/tau subunit